VRIVPTGIKSQQHHGIYECKDHLIHVCTYALALFKRLYFELLEKVKRAHLVAEQLGLRDPTAPPEEATSRRDTDARQIIVVFIGRPDTMGGLSKEVATLPRSI